MNLIGLTVLESYLISSDVFRIILLPVIDPDFQVAILPAINRLEFL